MVKHTEWLKNSKAVQDHSLAFTMFPTTHDEGICLGTADGRELGVLVRQIRSQ